MHSVEHRYRESFSSIGVEKHFRASDKQKKQNMRSAQRRYRESFSSIGKEKHFRASDQRHTIAFCRASVQRIIFKHRYRETFFEHPTNDNKLLQLIRKTSFQSIVETHSKKVFRQSIVTYHVKKFLLAQCCDSLEKIIHCCNSLEKSFVHPLLQLI